MAEHIPRTEIERFSVSALSEEQQVSIANHLAECEACHRVLSETLRGQRGTEGLKFTLAPEFWFRHDHLDYEQLVGIAGDKLDATEREIIDIHLSTCATCREDVRSFLAFREQIEPELRVRYGPAAKAPPTATIAPRCVAPHSWRLRGCATASNRPCAPGSPATGSHRLAGRSGSSNSFDCCES